MIAYEFEQLAGDFSTAYDADKTKANGSKFLKTLCNDLTVLDAHNITLTDFRRFDVQRAVFFIQYRQFVAHFSPPPFGWAP